MSEAEKSAEIEDVLSSIRRLVADGPRVEGNKPQAINLASPRIEPPLTSPKDIDEAMEELQVTEDITPEVKSFVPEEDILVTTKDTITPLPEVKETAADGPITFVQAINASIAEIAKGQDNTQKDIEPVAEEISDLAETVIEETTTLTDDADEEARTAHVNAFLANETSMPSEIDAPKTEKTEPFVLRAEMAATPEAEGPVEELADIEDDIEEDTFEYTSGDDTEELELEDDIEDDDLETAAEAEPKGDAFIDEETLREIVSELVRSELQGDLGDRITRNVRKLVRREIHHALASREIP
ncbi:hypothetical protein F9L33_05430 [Amylibacter sp. SFDW26]|uniref:hypothetical protein n=1 Tax=Amylibacter sp. SFDW26 TaxID=2652722 RepID=UPI001261B0B2|nr:hypothetical protein [Amylibacter sp. SFDW26]KAB7616193.1 hypothetical protein F9L33_05430 [Amylibacter sp. SFDW26]